MINREYIESKIQEMIEEGVIKNKEHLMDISLDKLVDIACKMDVRPEELVAYFCGGNCEKCDKRPSRSIF